MSVALALALGGAGCLRGSTGCPAGYTRAQDLCIMTYEATFSGTPGRADQGAHYPDGSTRGAVRSVAGEVPSVGLSWYQAYAACAASGAHLCTSDEWEDACDGRRGAGGAEFPTRDGGIADGVCAVGGPAGVAGAPARVVDPPLAATGTHPDCRTPAGVRDLAGNAAEWTDPGRRDRAGRPRVDVRGGAHDDLVAVPCRYAAVGSRPPDVPAGIGFRCCRAPE